MRAAEAEIADLLEKVELREAFQEDLRAFLHREQEVPGRGAVEGHQGEPRRPPPASSGTSRTSYVTSPSSPAPTSPYSERIAKHWGRDRSAWADLGKSEGIGTMQKPELLFARLEDKEIDALRIRFSGYAERAPGGGRCRGAAGRKPSRPDRREFRGAVDLRAAKIVDIKRHPDAEKLYIETWTSGPRSGPSSPGSCPIIRKKSCWATPWCSWPISKPGGPPRRGKPGHAPRSSERQDR